MSDLRDREFSKAQRAHDAQEPPWTDAGEDDCTECGKPLDSDAQDDLDAELEDCETDEDRENVSRGAMCTACRRKEDGDDEE